MCLCGRVGRRGWIRERGAKGGEISGVYASEDERGTEGVSISRRKLGVSLSYLQCHHLY